MVAANEQGLSSSMYGQVSPVPPALLPEIWLHLPCFPVQWHVALFLVTTRSTQVSVPVAQLISRHPLVMVTVACLPAFFALKIILAWAFTVSKVNVESAHITPWPLFPKHVTQCSEPAVGLSK